MALPQQSLTSPPPTPRSPLCRAPRLHISPSWQATSPTLTDQPVGASCMRITASPVLPAAAPPCAASGPQPAPGQTPPPCAPAQGTPVSRLRVAVATVNGFQLGGGWTARWWTECSLTAKSGRWQGGSTRGQQEQQDSLPWEQTDSEGVSMGTGSSSGGSSGSSGDGGSLFTEPLRWMAGMVIGGPVQGKLYCPK